MLTPIEQQIVLGMYNEELEQWRHSSWRRQVGAAWFRVLKVMPSPIQSFVPVKYRR